MSWPNDAGAAIREAEAELATLGFTHGGFQWPDMAICRDCGSLVPCPMAVPDLTWVRVHAAWHEGVSS